MTVAGCDAALGYPSPAIPADVGPVSTDLVVGFSHGGHSHRVPGSCRFQLASALRSRSQFGPASIRPSPWGPITPISSPPASITGSTTIRTSPPTTTSTTAANSIPTTLSSRLAPTPRFRKLQQPPRPAVELHSHLDDHQRSRKRGPFHLYAGGAAWVLEAPKHQRRHVFLHRSRRRVLLYRNIRLLRDYTAEFGTSGYLGITPGLPSNLTGVPFVNIAGGRKFGNNLEGFLPQVGNSFQWADGLTWVKGNHTFKFGVDIRRARFDQYYYFDLNGDYTFDNTGPNAIIPAMATITPSFCWGWRTFIRKAPVSARTFAAPPSIPLPRTVGRSSRTSR